MKKLPKIQGHCLSHSSPPLSSEKILIAAPFEGAIIDVLSMVSPISVDFMSIGSLIALFLQIKYVSSYLKVLFNFFMKVLVSHFMRVVFNCFDLRYSMKIAFQIAITRRVEQDWVPRPFSWNWVSSPFSWNWS